ncbi:unnamed protein product [Ascophyllum nodosum]
MHFAVWALCVSNVLPLVRSFTTSHPRIMRVSCVRGRSGLRPRSRISAGARQPLRLTPDEKVEGANVADKAVSDFGQTSGPVKAFVSGLTDMFVTLSGEDKEAYSDKKSGIIRKEALSVSELEASIRREYAKNYLWTGDIDDRLYEEDCSFTDPTLSFSGLATYKRNVGSLQGILNFLVTKSRSELYSCDLRQEDSCVETRWRMMGELRLPWGPTIDVVGRTRFSYDPDRGNRIWSYDEVWEVEPAEALMQLFRPGIREDDPGFSE